MALILTNSIFFHIPKTGGTSVRQALIRATGTDREICNIHSLPCECGDILKYRTPFLFVRKPEDWYFSFWSYRMKNYWHLPIGVGKTALDKFCKADKFDKFMDKVYDRCYGYLTTLYGMYITNPEIVHIGRTETLMDDIIRFLKEFKEPFNIRRLKATPRKNVSTMKKYMLPSTRKKIRRMEKTIYKRFYD